MKKLLAAAASVAMLAMPTEIDPLEIVPNSYPPTAYQTIVGDADKPLGVTLTVNWVKVSFSTTQRGIKHDGIFWRNAHFDDWDVVPNGLSEKGLQKMLEKYGNFIQNKDIWEKMSYNEWDIVPQPVRSMAFMKMLDYWSGIHESCRTEDGSDTLKAIVMGESWFEHRAINQQKGNIDIGLPGASNYARKAINRIYKRDIRDEDYFNPYIATEAAALWFGRMLQEARCDRNLAVRAYYKGIRRARDGDGTEYLENINRIRNEYIRNMGNSQAWQFLHTRTQ
ncbi:MAG: transglycosylase SLT domain-containing protein [Candidatus Aenigmatarchaeota archaeon]